MASKIKILITVEGGIVQSVCTNNPDCKVVIIDYDDKGDEPVLVSEVLEPDMVINENELFYKKNFKGPLHASELIAKEQLKDLKF